MFISELIDGKLIFIELELCRCWYWLGIMIDLLFPYPLSSHQCSSSTPRKYYIHQTYKLQRFCNGLQRKQMGSEYSKLWYKEMQMKVWQRTGIKCNRGAEASVIFSFIGSWRVSKLQQKKSPSGCINAGLNVNILNPRLKGFDWMWRGWNYFLLETYQRNSIATWEENQWKEWNKMQFCA